MVKYCKNILGRGKRVMIIKCLECNNDISTGAETCPHCGLRLMKRNSNGSVKASPLSIIGIIFSLLCTPLGFFLCIIDLCANDKSYSHDCSVAGLIISIMILGFIFLMILVTAN